jgi:hypothetical protein
MASGRRCRTRAFLVIAFASGCGAPPFAPGQQVSGRWGGEGFALDVTPEAASARFDCAYGNLETPIVLGVDHRFTTSGDYVREVGPAALRNPARYEGRVKGRTVELSVLVTDTLAQGGTYTMGPFNGTLGGVPRVYYCQ